MRMLNIKRFMLGLLVLFSLLIVAIGSSVYFFNVNDYSLWISKQIEQSTGYDLRFEHFENNWLADNSITLTGLSLYQQQQRVLHIKRFELKVDKLDVWQRQLEIASVSLRGVEVDMQQPSILVKNSVASKQRNTNLQSIAWERLHIAKLEIIDLNAALQKEDKKLHLTQANIELNDVLIIKQNQLQLLPQKLSFISDFQRLIITNKNQKATLDNLQLSANAVLLQRQAVLNISTDKIQLESSNDAPVQLQSLSVSLQLEGNKLSLSDFLVNTFSGSLALQAEALLAINLLPAPTIKVHKLIVHSLLAKDMQLDIPVLPEANEGPSQTVITEPLPVEELLIKTAKLENISVFSESEKFPLQLKSVDAQINNLYIIQDHFLLDVDQLEQQNANFALAFDYFSWKKIKIEEFTIAGSLIENDPAWDLLKGIFTPK